MSRHHPSPVDVDRGRLPLANWTVIETRIEKLFSRLRSSAIDCYATSLVTVKIIFVTERNTRRRRVYRTTSFRQRLRPSGHRIVNKILASFTSAAHVV
ncbi:hypothetical protein EVAR_45304_1 [Eumeta japonica]|uniref:Uncharacterized protein n=1 Tax=Eumeta variegata TaxID=151549 RepID=A0A4C1XJZ9_EUMVA|nr:hypothetical protein EVAR_45304_1 [Eumeta japonica]